MMWRNECNAFPLWGKSELTFMTCFWREENGMGVRVGQCGCSTWGHMAWGKEDRESRRSHL